MKSEKKLFLLDAFALIYRAYFAFIKNPRINSKGLDTSAVFGFVGIFTLATVSLAAPQVFQINPDLVAFPTSR